jgi:NADH pyrophosphatase NudC (nudix superfamily)
VTKESDAYAQVARRILDNLREQLGFERVEGKQAFPGSHGRDWSIDVSCYRAGDGALIIVECRRHTSSRIKQEEMGAFAYRIQSIGAAGGLMVTPLGFQAGARAIASLERIATATLNADATEEEFVLTIADQVFRGLKVSDQGHGVDTVRSIIRICDHCNTELTSSDGGHTFYCPQCGRDA